MRGYRLRHSVVTVCESFNGEIKVLYDGKALGWEKNMLMARSLYHWMMKKSVHERVDNARFDLRSKFYVQNLKLTILGSRAARKVISK